MMGLTGLGFVIFSFVTLIAAFVMDGGAVKALWEPTAFLIVFGGTIGAVGLSFPLDDIKKIPRHLKKAFVNKSNNMEELLLVFQQLSAKSRKNGLLSLESDINKPHMDPFAKKGLQLVIDGVEPDNIRGILETEAEMDSFRTGKVAAIFESAGGYSPTMGILGTVMGLVHVLGNLGAPSELGKKITVAFIATLYGVAAANLLWLPIGNRITVIDEHEYNRKAMITESVLLIQSGVNPNTMLEKLKGFLENDKRNNRENSSKEVA